MAKTVVAYKGNKRIVKRTRENAHNYLKYWRIVRYWAKRKYEITDTELEILLFLYDIELFTRSQYKQFEGLIAWDKTRFNHLRDKGFIVQWRERQTRKQAQLFTLSVKAKRIVATVYKKLLQEEHIPENGKNNPIFKGDNYMDRVYRNAIRKMNAERDARIRREREAELGI